MYNKIWIPDHKIATTMAAQYQHRNVGMHNNHIAGCDIQQIWQTNANIPSQTFFICLKQKENIHGSHFQETSV